MSLNQEVNKKKGKCKNGFTILELLIAMSIFSIGFLAVASMQMTANFGNRSAIDTTEASTYASDYLERQLALPYASMADGVADVAGKYHIEWTVTADTPITSASTITVVVTWASTIIGRSQRSISLDFIRTDDV